MVRDIRRAVLKRIGRPCHMLLTTAITIFFSATLNATPLPAVDFSSVEVEYSNDFPWSLGFEFEVWEDVNVVGLGFYDSAADGFLEDHKVGLYDFSGSLLAEATITNDDALNGLFRWESVMPIMLHAGETYVVGGFGFLDPYTWNPPDAFVDSRVYIPAARYSYSEDLAFPEERIVELFGLFGPNLLLADLTDPPTEVAAPSGVLLLVFGFALIFSRRYKLSILVPSVCGGLLFSLPASSLELTGEPVQGDSTWAGQVPLGSRYYRYQYNNVGVIAKYDRVLDASGNYLVPVGETLRWVWLRNGAASGYFEQTYVGGAERCWVSSTGTRNCGNYNQWLAFSNYKCRPEHGRYEVVLYRSGQEVVRQEFDAERFKMNTGPSMWAVPTEFRPIRQAGRYGEPHGEEKALSFRVTDDLGCRQALSDVKVSLRSEVVPGTNQHQHFRTGDLGKGKFVQDSSFPLDEPTDNATANGKTNSSGQFRVKYQAMHFALDESVKVKFLRPAENGYVEDRLEGSFAWKIRMGDYIEADIYPQPWAQDAVCGHTIDASQARSLRADVWPDLLSGLESFRLMTVKTVRLNDASFQNGGVVDTTLEKGCEIGHSLHRQGIDIDISRTTDGGPHFDLVTGIWRPWADVEGLAPIRPIPYIEVLTRKLRINGFRKIEEPHLLVHYQYTR